LNIKELVSQVSDLSDVIENIRTNNTQKSKELDKKIEGLEKKFNTQKRTLSWQQGFIIVILITCFIAFIFLIIDAWRFNGEKKKEYQQTIEQLKNENLELKINQLVNYKIDSIYNLKVNQKNNLLTDTASKNIKKKK